MAEETPATGITIEEELILDWTTAVEALDLDSIQEIYDIQPDLLWTPLQPMAHLENDFAHFIRRLKEFDILGTSIRPVYALHHILFDYGLEGDEWAPERIALVDFILKKTKGDELNRCRWGDQQNTVMHLAYLLNQEHLTQQLLEKGASNNIPNKSGHLPTKEVGKEEQSTTSTNDTTTTTTTSTTTTSTINNNNATVKQEDAQPEVKLLINKNKSKEGQRVLPLNASDRFKRLRELAESPSANKNRPTERHNSTRRYFRPGHLEERKRQVLSEEEEAELEKQRLKRQKEVAMLAQRSAVKNNPLFKKFEGQKEQEENNNKPVISAASAIRDRKKLLGAADQIRRSSRVINSLKDRSYVSGSVFRQQSNEASGGEGLRVPTLAQLRGTLPVSRDASPNASDNEDEDKKSKKKEKSIKLPSETASTVPTPPATPATDATMKEAATATPKLASAAAETAAPTLAATQSPKSPTTPTSSASPTAPATPVTPTSVAPEPTVSARSASVTTAMPESVTPVTSSSVTENNNKDILVQHKDKTDSSTLSSLDTKDAHSTRAIEDEVEALSIGKLNAQLPKSPTAASKKKMDVGYGKVKEIVQVHEHINDEEEIEIYSTGKVFSVWDKIPQEDPAVKGRGKAFAGNSSSASTGSTEQQQKAIDENQQQQQQQQQQAKINDSVTSLSPKPAVPARSKSRPTSKRIAPKKEPSTDSNPSLMVSENSLHLDTINETAALDLSKTEPDSPRTVQEQISSGAFASKTDTASSSGDVSSDLHHVPIQGQIKGHQSQENNAYSNVHDGYSSESLVDNLTFTDRDISQQPMSSEKGSNNHWSSTESLIDNMIDTAPVQQQSIDISDAKGRSFSSESLVDGPYSSTREIDPYAVSSGGNAVSLSVDDQPTQFGFSYSASSEDLSIVHTYQSTATRREGDDETHLDSAHAKEQDVNYTTATKESISTHLHSAHYSSQESLSEDSLHNVTRGENQATNKIDVSEYDDFATKNDGKAAASQSNNSQYLDKMSPSDQKASTVSSMHNTPSAAANTSISESYRNLGADRETALQVQNNESSKPMASSNTLSGTDRGIHLAISQHDSEESKTSPSTAENLPTPTLMQYNTVESNRMGEYDNEDEFTGRSRSYSSSTTSSSAYSANYDAELFIDRKLDTDNPPTITTKNKHTQQLPSAINTVQTLDFETDEEEATTPTLANPHTLTQQQQQQQQQNQQHQEKTEWTSAYDTLLQQQQQQQELDFEDDAHRQDTRLSTYSSDANESSILKTLSSHTEARYDRWSANEKSESEKTKKRQSGSQRSYWSTGIQLATHPMPTASVGTSSETGSDQWYDPDDDWTVRSNRSRQSQVNNSSSEGRHSDVSSTFSFKNSNLTDNTKLEDDDEEDDKHRHDDYVISATQHVPPKQSIQQQQQQYQHQDEDDDYYSTMLHTSAAAARTANSATTSAANNTSTADYYGSQKEEIAEEEEGEITVFMNQFHGNESNQSSLVLPSSDTSRVEYPSASSAKTVSHDTLIKIPSRTIDIADAGIVQEPVPHDPNHPRVEDISHYMKALPSLEQSDNNGNGTSAYDLDQQQDAIVKRAISVPAHTPQDPEQLKTGIPHAHEVNEAFFSAIHQHENDSKISMSSIEANAFGKMYIGISGAHHVLLPLPKEITYVRCVISDGEYEYMSRYEILSHQILMDYECVIDTKPGMIITVSLHVRPDYHVKPRTGWSRWFTSIRKQKEHLSGYVHPEDGAIGQTRFAVDRMVPGCYKKTYEAHFDCFNSWYARTNRERARREQFGDEEDFLKIVGKLNIEMLYLPVSNPSVPVPRSLRECDLTLKIRQWHDTCWQSGHLSTRRQGSKVWERHFYRLIGSQLIGYTNENNSRQVWDHYNIADVLRLSAAADKVIVTLLEEDENKVFDESNIHDNHKGFFRLTFPDYYLDCVSDDLEESEEWVKTLKSMIGRVPLRLPFSE